MARRALLRQTRSRRNVLSLASTGVGSLALLVVCGAALVALVRVRASSPVPLKLEITNRRTLGDEVFKYLQGEPIRLDITITYPQASEARAAQHNLGRPDIPIPRLGIAPPGGKWTDFVEVEFRRKGAWRADPAFARFGWRGGIEKWLESHALFHEVAEQPLSIVFKVPPAVTQLAQPGEYSVVASFDNTGLPRRGFAAGLWSGRVESEPFRFSIARPAGAAQRSRVLQEQFWFAVEQEVDPRDLEKVALEAVELAPNDPAALRVLAAAYMANRKWREALPLYERMLSMARPPGPTESPGGWIELHGIIRSLKERIAKEESGKGGASGTE